MPDVNMGNAREATDQMSGAGINLYLLTDQVRFYRDHAPVRLAEISRVVFSEIMRDVDLFVGVRVARRGAQSSRSSCRN
jgi:hypothetical protein